MSKKIKIPITDGKYHLGQMAKYDYYMLKGRAQPRYLFFNSMLLNKQL